MVVAGARPPLSGRFRTWHRLLFERGTIDFAMHKPLHVPFVMDGTGLVTF
jgi:hypothetical protein